MHEPKKSETKRNEEARESSTGRAYQDLVSSLFTGEEETEAPDDEKESE